MRRDANCDGRPARSDNVRNDGGLLKDKCQWSGPECGGEFVGTRRPIDGERFCCSDVGDVDYDRVVCGATLRFEDARHGLCVECIRAEAVDGLGGKCDEAAGAKDLGGSGDCLRVYRLAVRFAGQQLNCV